MESAPKTIVDRERIQTAQQLLTAFFVLAKTAHIYEPNNDSYRSQMSRFITLFRTYVNDQECCMIKVLDDRLFVDDRFISLDTDDRIGVREMLGRWTELGIGGMIIGESAGEGDIVTLINLLLTFTVPGGEPFKLICAKLADEGVDSISLLACQKTAPDEPGDHLEDRQQMRRQARQTFFQAIATVKNVMSSVAQQGSVPIARTKRVVHTIIDQLSEDESALLELASIKDFDQYTYAHSINVSVYAIALGLRLELGRLELSELGFAALFHDIGKVKLPVDLVTKADRFDEFDWVQMRRHPILGAMTIARMLKLDSHMARALIVAYEHHINTDGSGYPTLPEPRPSNLYSRIISIADNYDALTSGRVYIKESIPPDEVLRKLMYQMSIKFDAFLLKLFISIIGIYPVGSLVLLSDRSLGIVTRTNRAEPNRPELRLIADGAGPINPPRWCDLADAASRSLDIAGIIDPERYGIDITSYILSD